MSFERQFTFDGHPIFLLGEKASGFLGNVQDYYSIRQKCLETKTLFEDPEFPCTDKSLFYSHPADRRYEWLRPHKICGDPQFFVEGYSRFDVMQGELGDCWFLAAAANLTLDVKLFFRVVCEDNSFEENYAGIFHFRFWQYGKWVDVVVDDRLPTYRGELMYMHSEDKKEFWSALLEKAYAKLNGSYEGLKAGATSEALEDFTGGVTEVYDLKQAPSNLFSFIEKGFRMDSMMGCSIEPDPNAFEALTPQGLVRGHAYSITKAVMVDVVTPKVSGKIPLLCLRNPWGDVEWNGAWKDKSPEWQYIPNHVKESLGITFDTDGEFWISYRDFLKYFDRMDVCNLSPDSLSGDPITSGKKWNMNVFEGEWISGVSAGGCRNFLETFHRNPQFVLTIDKPDEDDEFGMCTIVLALMQKNRRLKRKADVSFLTIGFALYRLKESDVPEKPQKLDFFKHNISTARLPAFINMREVSYRFKLAPGQYLIVPSTYKPNEDGEFLIRVFTECCHTLVENEKAICINRIQSSVTQAKPSDHQRRSNDLPKPIPRRTEHEKMFLEIAGTKKTIGWADLKRILDDLLNDDVINFKNTPTDGPFYPVLIEMPTTHSRIRKFFSNVAGHVRRPCISGANPNDNKTDNKDAQLSLSTPAVVKVTPPGFSENLCRSMIAMLDPSFSGQLGLSEFQLLYNDVVTWKATFKQYDRDHSNRLDVSELREAFAFAGYQLNNRVLNSLVYRYGSDDQTISLDDFILCAVKVRTMMQHFKEKDFENKGETKVTADEWIINSIYS